MIEAHEFQDNKILTWDKIIPFYSGGREPAVTGRIFEGKWVSGGKVEQESAVHPLQPTGPGTYEAALARCSQQVWGILF